MLKNSVVFVVFFAISLVIGEWVLRQFVFDPNAGYIRPPGYTMDVYLEDKVPNLSGDHTVTISSLGIRTEPPDWLASDIIAIFGGSTVENWPLEHDESWSHLLDDKLEDCRPGAWTGNFGKSGVNARHHLIQMPEVFKYAPDFDLVIVLAGLNDFLYDYHIHHSYETGEGWWEQQALAYLPGEEGQFATLAIIRRLWSALTSDSPPPVSHFGTYHEGLRDAWRAVPTEHFVDDIRILPEHGRTYRETLIGLADIAEEEGFDIIFLTQPYIWSDSMTEEARDLIYAGFIGPTFLEEGVDWYTTGALKKGLSDYNETMLALCEERNFTCFDLEKAIPKEASYFYDDFHFSEVGQDRVATEVAGFLKESYYRCN